MQGLGYNTCEEVTYDPQGNLTSTNTWLYKPPSTLEIPQVLNVHLWPTQDQVQTWVAEEAAASADAKKPAGKAVHEHPKSSASDNHVRKSWVRMNQLDIKLDTYGCQSSKATGEPPTVLGNSIYWAIRNAVKAALADPITAAMRADWPEIAGKAATPTACAASSPSDGAASSSSASPTPLSVSVPADVRVLCPATTFNIRQAISSGGDPTVQLEAVRARQAAALEARAKKDGAAGLAAVAPVSAEVQSAASAPSTVAALVPSGAGAEVAASAVEPVVAAQ